MHIAARRGCVDIVKSLQVGGKEADISRQDNIGVSITAISRLSVLSTV